MLSQQDQNQLAAKGISEEKLNKQLESFKTGFPFLRLEAAASIGHGIMAPTEEERENYIKAWDSYKAEGHQILKFVPASGAASRMFKDMFAFLSADYDVPTTPFEKQFFEHIKEFAFREELCGKCHENEGKKIMQLISEGNYKAVVANMLEAKGLNYGQLPKGLLLFHNYEDGPRTPMEEHLVEAALYASSNGEANVHFTVSHEHMELFKAKVAEKADGFAKKFGIDSNPQTFSHLMFDKKFREEVKSLLPADYDQLNEKEQEAAKAKAEAESPLMNEARAMLVDWEKSDKEIRDLWAMMNQWVYDGFDVTYKRMGVSFEKIYYESQTYLLGKSLVQEGLDKGVLYRRDDNSVWCDLRDEGLDEKLLLRRDGTSVYMTQDLGTAQLRVDEFNPEKLIYVVGNEQNYHFDVLKRVLLRLGRQWGNDIEHLSYGMVELPNGKMKSREGTVVDADDLMDEMVATAKAVSQELGKAEGLTPVEAENLYNAIGLGALKYFILRVDPKKTILFNPAESIDFNGNTGPFVQYTHARICSVLRKAKAQGIEVSGNVKVNDIQPKEKDIIVLMYSWPSVLKQAAEGRSPAMIANFIYDLAKCFNQFYQECSILKESDETRRDFRLQICGMVAALLRNASQLLGMGMPERM